MEWKVLGFMGLVLVFLRGGGVRGASPGRRPSRDFSPLPMDLLGARLLTRSLRDLPKSSVTDVCSRLLALGSLRFRL